MFLVFIFRQTFFVRSDRKFRDEKFGILIAMSPLVLAIVCFVIAAVLAVVDLLIPSGGVLAVASLVASLVSVYFGFQSSYAIGVATLALMLVCIPVFIAVALRLWPHTPIGKRVILKAPPQAEPPLEAEQQQLQELVGLVGVAQSPLMPYGFIRLLGRTYNAMCDSGVIEIGQNVLVTAVQQRNLVVTRTTRPPSSGSSSKATEPTAPPESLLDIPAEDLGLDSID